MQLEVGKFFGFVQSAGNSDFSFVYSFIYYLLKNH